MLGGWLACTQIPKWTCSTSPGKCKLNLLPHPIPLPKRRCTVSTLVFRQRSRNPREGYRSAVLSKGSSAHEGEHPSRPLSEEFLQHPAQQSTRLSLWKLTVQNQSHWLFWLLELLFWASHERLGEHNESFYIPCSLAKLILWKAESCLISIDQPLE